MQSFSFNTYVANLMELNNTLLRAKETPVYGTAPWDEAVEALLLMLAPACPHIAEELWERSGRPTRSTSRPGRPGTNRLPRKK